MQAYTGLYMRLYEPQVTDTDHMKVNWPACVNALSDRKLKILSKYCFSFFIAW